MALATTCPACSTSFKVNPEQLKLRRGLVRCGMCQHVFSGVEFLRYVSDSRANSAAGASVASTRSPNPAPTVPASARPSSPADRQPSAPAETTTAPASGNATESRSAPDTVPDIEADSIPAGAGDGASNSDDGPSTIAGDLKTAFFLPETSFNPAGSFGNDNAQQQSLADDETPTLTGGNAGGDAGGGGAGDSVGNAGGNADARETGSSYDSGSGSAAQDDPAFIERRGKRAGRRRNRKSGRNRRQKQGSAGKDVARDPAHNRRAEDRDPVGEDDGSRHGGRRADDANGRDERRTARAGSQEPEPGRPPAANAWPMQQTAADEADIDVPDIQAPDTEPGNTDDRLIAQLSGVQSPSKEAARRADALVRALSGEDADPSSEPGRAARAKTAGATSPNGEGDAIDYFGSAAGSSFDLDLPPRRVWMVAAVLCAVLALQVILGARDSIAARFPALRAPLATLTSPFGLKVELPLDDTSVSIRSFELAAASNTRANTRYTMIMLLSNEARHAMRWPAVELTLTNGIGEILVRKVLLPGEYLADAQAIESGIAANSEKIVRIGLTADNVNPVGYSAVLFHP